MSTVRIATADQMMKNPIQRAVDISSPSTVTPRMNCIVGVMYCIIPTQDSGTRRVAAPNRMSGIAVTGPSESMMSVWPIPSVPKCEFPLSTNQAMAASANGVSTVDSTVSPSSAPTRPPTLFLMSP